MPFMPMWKKVGTNLENIGGTNVALKDSGGTTRFAVDGTGMGFFNTTPVGQQSRAPTPAANVNDLKISFDALQDALASYGLLS